ncbi:hypothetical protein DFJ58DRAFT_730279 [Suillus subalutaceus]|uniref:uncharacterized protein n=1 Tax=Suillus subalutaceus TaxID=48586 RepID=UPI001B8655D5|nr:uncharacterized protein DFJ58DRAFT_730279 [Suillus subalutaceus]KAG1847184.1 hypothetical protein DFJ58DRAFT_730279 [Suillus subalutaceus]
MSISFADLVTCMLIYHSVFQAIALFNAGQCEEAMLLINKLAAVCPNTDALMRRVVEADISLSLICFPRDLQADTSPASICFSHDLQADTSLVLL